MALLFMPHFLVAIPPRLTAHHFVIVSSYIYGSHGEQFFISEKMNNFML